MKSIPLSRSMIAHVSDCDYVRLSRYSWVAHESKKGRFYARARINGRRVYMHCLIMGHRGVDHKNKVTLDNRRSNLRKAGQSNNMANACRPITNTSGFKGVTWHALRGRWAAQIMVNKRNHYLGLFSDLIKAARAYDRAAIEKFGEFAYLNFPKSKTKNQKI
jgi:hypothetical protein